MSYKTKPNWVWHNIYIGGITVLVISLLLLLYSWKSYSYLTGFKENGVTAKAIVVEKRSSKSVSTKYYRKLAEQSFKVSFWTAPLLKGGELIFTDINDFIGYEAWKKIHKDDVVDIIYLPNKPKHAILLSSLEKSSLAPAERYEFALLILLLGVGLTALGKYKKSINL